MTQSTSRLVIEISAEHARRNAEMLSANVSNYNFIDPVAMYKHAMSTPEGTKVLINSISENSTAVKRATQ